MGSLPLCLGSWPQITPFSYLSLLGACCHLVATGRMHPVDWGCVWAALWDKHLTERLLGEVYHMGTGVWR